MATTNSTVFCQFSDAARLLSFYQLWLDDLFPKAKFLDALAMVEKAGHKTSMHRQRMEWINEGKPKAMAWEDDDEFREGRPPSPAREPTRIAPIFEKRTGAAEGRSTPTVDDLFGDEDIYNATPRPRTAERNHGGEPDDELDALMAQEEAEGQATRQGNGTTSGPKPFTSIFGGGGLAQPAQQARTSGDPDQDELDALMAEAEAEAEISAQKNTKGTQETVVRSIFGDGKPKASSKQVDEDDMDDLDALMAEAEASGPPSRPSVPAASAGKELGTDTTDFAAEEEAMAEMDGLWD